MPIQRITSFKVVNDADIPSVLEAYKVLASTQQKDGKPYILSANAYATLDDPRRQNYKVTAVTKFTSMEDVKYYDEACAAHQALKGKVLPKIEGSPLTLLMEIPEVEPKL